MTATTDVLRFGDVAARLAENGYSPVPLHFGEKIPVPEKWPSYRFHEPDAERFRACGTGIICGNVVGLDIDVRNAELAAELDRLAEEFFGPAPRRIGNPPKVLRVLSAVKPFTKVATRGYRLNGDSPEDKAHKVEILAEGQQFVAYNRHPDTSKPYTWNGCGDPLTVPIGMLPPIDEASARQFIAKADELLARRGRPVGRLSESDDGRAHVPNEELRAHDPVLLREALAFVPNADLGYDDWIRVGYAIKGALGDDGRDDFLRWSARAAKNDPAYSESAWASMKPQKSGAGTIYWLAAENGWKRPTRAANEWADPVNVFAELAAPPFEAADLPPPLAEFPSLWSRSTGIDPSITLTAAVVIAAAALRDDIQLCADSGSQWFAQARLWVVALGAPGHGKTPGQREMLKPAWALHSELDEAWRQSVRGLGEEDEKPSRPRVVLGDVTLEALSEVLVDNPRGCLMATDEFDAWLGSLDQYRSGNVGRDRGEWLRLFDGGPHTIERVKRGTFYIPNWGLSILTATTPAAMHRLARHLPVDGLLQRFIIVLAQRQQIASDAPAREALEDARARYVATIRRLWNVMPRARNGVVQLSFEARQMFDQWRVENQRLQEAVASLDSSLEAHVAKYPTLALRLALTFHAVSVVQAENENGHDPAAFPVSSETMGLALRFLRRAGQHAFALYLGRKGGSEAYELARAVARYVLARTTDENTKGLARRDLIQRVRSFRDANEAVQHTAMGLLVDLGWLHEADGVYHKANVSRWHVNPSAQRKFASAASEERERRAIVRERISEAVREREASNGQG